MSTLKLLSEFANSQDALNTRSSYQHLRISKAKEPRDIEVKRSSFTSWEEGQTWGDVSGARLDPRILS